MKRSIIEINKAYDRVAEGKEGFLAVITTNNSIFDSAWAEGIIFHRRSQRTRRQTLDPKGPRLGQPLDRPNTRMVLKDGHLFVIFVIFCENAYAGWLSKRRNFLNKQNCHSYADYVAVANGQLEVCHA